jgi:type I restriction enzyme R subunit
VGPFGRGQLHLPDAQTPYAGAGEPPPSETVIREGALKTLQDTVTGLNLDNFLVRQRRRAVEKYREPKA